MPFVERPIRSGPGGPPPCYCEWEGFNCSTCRGVETVWEDEPRTPFSWKQEFCLFLTDEYGVEITIAATHTNYPPFVKHKGVIYERRIGNRYIEFEVPEFEQEVDEVI
jgi:hypothetical protein